MADKAKLLKIAQKHLSKGNVDKAITTFQQLVEVAPRDQRLLLRLAELQARVGRKKEAIQNYEKIASVYIEQDFTPKAIAVYKTILRLDPELLPAYEKLADLYKKQGLEAEAISHLENLFAVYEKKNDEAKQIDVLKIMVEMDHENLGIQVRLGEMLAKKGMKQEAGEAFAKAASTLSRRGFHDRASQLFEKIINLNPDNIAVRRELCGHYLESGQFMEAKREIEAIIEMEPDDPRMVLLLGRILFQIGKKSEAEENIGKSIKLFQQLGELDSVLKEFLFVAQSHLRNDEFDEAEAFYRHVLEAIPDETKAIKGLVSIAESRSDRVGQIENLLLLGRTLDRKEDNRGAKKAYGKILELDPLNEEAKNFIESAASLSEELAEEAVGEAEALEVESVEFEEIEAEPEQVDDAVLLEEYEIETGQEQGVIEEPEEISVEEMEELGGLELEEVEDEGPEEVLEKMEMGEEALPDIVLEDFGDEAEVQFEAVSEDGLPIGQEGEQEGVNTIDDLLAEAEVYKRYGLDEKLEETIRQINSLAPEDPDVLRRIESLNDSVVGIPDAEAAGGAPPVRETAGLPPAEESMEPDVPSVETVPAAVEEPEPEIPAADPFQEELEEAEFYLSQGLEDEAHRIYRSILQRSPGHPVAMEAIAGPDQVPSPDQAAAEPEQEEVVRDILQDLKQDVVAPDTGKVPLSTPMTREIRSKLIVEDSASEDVGGFLDLADELRSELSEEFEHDTEPDTHDEPVTFEEIFAQFKKGIEETLGDEEFETHYNLGIAYKDMGLLDDALREFEIGSRDPDLAQDSLSLMAMCFLEKKDYDSAVKAVLKAMEVCDEGSRTGLNYQLGQIKEKGKDWQGALEAYIEVQSRDASFEGIEEALQRVKSHADLTVPEEEVEAPIEGGMDDMLSDLIKEVEEMAKENTDEPGGEPGKSKKDRISYL